MDLEGIMLSEISHREKDKYCMISLVMWNLKNKTKEQTTAQKELEVQRTNRWLPKVMCLKPEFSCNGNSQCIT